MGAWLKKRLGWVCLAALAVVLVTQCTTSTLMASPSLTKAGVWLYTLVPICGAFVVLAAAQEAETLSLGWRHPVGLWFGKLSYGLYAYHGLLIVLVGEKMIGQTYDTLTRGAVIVLGSIALATASYFGMERPLSKLRSQLQAVPSGSR
ncbi:MAG: hypothetical protein ABUL49_01730, partial [bacterium]